MCPLHKYNVVYLGSDICLEMGAADSIDFYYIPD